MSKPHYTSKAFILHTAIYENGELIAILPPDNRPAWRAMVALLYSEMEMEPPF